MVTYADNAVLVPGPDGTMMSERMAKRKRLEASTGGGTVNPALPNETSIPYDNGTENQFTLPEDKYPYSGLPESYRDQLLGFVMPQLQGAVGSAWGNIGNFEQNARNAYTPVNMAGTNTPVDQNTFTPVDLQSAYGNIDEGSQQALGAYQQQLQSYLKDMIPKNINQLANRGVLSSTVASDTLSDTASQGARDASSRGYETLMAAAQQKANLGGQAALQESNMRSNFAQQSAMQNASNKNQFAQQAAMTNAATQNQQKYNTALQSTLMRNNIPNTLAGLLQYGQSQQDPSIMYRTMADLLASL